MPTLEIKKKKEKRIKWFFNKVFRVLATEVDKNDEETRGGENFEGKLKLWVISNFWFV